MQDQTEEQQNKKKAKAKSGFRWTVARRIVQIGVLVLFCLPMVLAGWGLLGAGIAPTDDAVAAPGDLPFFGTLSGSSVFGLNLVDPFAVLQIMAASKTVALGWIIGVLPVLAFYGIIRGRAFCGWSCPVNLVLEGVDWLRAKLKLKVYERVLPRHAKLYVALAVLALSAILSVPLFEVLSPISAINKGLVLGATTGDLTLLAIVLVELFWGHRVWCRALCPLGGFYEAVGKVGLVNVKMDHDACIGCDKCKRACLCDPQILDDVVAGNASAVCAGDCMVCGKCVDACPTGALSLGLGRK